MNDSNELTHHIYNHRYGWYRCTSIYTHIYIYTYIIVYCNKRKSIKEYNKKNTYILNKMNVLLETATTNGAGGSAFFFAWMGVATGLVFANLGSAYGTAKAGVGLMSMGVMNPGAVMKNVLPIILAAVLGIYGLIVAIIISSNGKYFLHIYIYIQNDIYIFPRYLSYLYIYNSF